MELIKSFKAGFRGAMLDAFVVGLKVTFKRYASVIDTSEWDEEDWRLVAEDFIKSLPRK